MLTNIYVFVQLLLCAGFVSMMATVFLWFLFMCFAFIIGEKESFDDGFTIRLFCGIWFIAFILVLIGVPVIRIGITLCISGQLV